MEKKELDWLEFEKYYSQLLPKLPEKKLIDIVVGISSGGLVLSKIVADYLDKPLAIIAARAYPRSKTKRETDYGEWGGIATIDRVEGNILIVDDLVEKGMTLSATYNRFKRTKGITEIKTTTMFVKPERIFTPDFYVEETDKWIVFPYEQREFNM